MQAHMACQLLSILKSHAAYQDIHSLHLCQGVKVAVGVVQVERHTIDICELRTNRQLQLGVAPLQQLVVVLDASLVVALNEGHLESGGRLLDDWQMLAVVLHYLQGDQSISASSRGTCNVVRWCLGRLTIF